MSNSAKSKKSRVQALRDGLMTYYLENDNMPGSVYLLTKSLAMKEETFYKYYNSLESLEKSIWVEMFENTRQTLHSDPSYEAFDAREQLLAFYYTFIEHLKGSRSYVIKRLKPFSQKEIYPGYLAELRKVYLSFAEELITVGKESGEIAGRKFIDKKYKEGLWIQLLFVINFWIRDESSQFEDTDVAIEKAVNLSFELMGEGPLEKMIDFAKFLYQHR